MHPDNPEAIGPITENIHIRAYPKNIPIGFSNLHFTYIWITPRVIGLFGYALSGLVRVTFTPYLGGFMWE
jgi:hypothetical protein